MRHRTRLPYLLAALTLFTACGDDGGTPPVQTPTVAVAATTSSATIARGATATYPITITRGGGFTGAVTLSATGLPSDVVASFSPATLPNGTTGSTLSLTAGANAAASTSTITVTASGNGVSSASTSVTLTVSAPTASITLASGSATATATVGGTTTVPLNITRTNFTGDVAIAISGLPTGVTATLNPVSPLGNGVNATTLTLSAGATAVPGTNNITITASGAGVTSQTQTVALTVNAAATPGFTLTAAPATVTATAGAGGTSTITLARQGGFTGDVALTVTGAPTGVTATMSPTTLTGAATTSTLTLASTAATAPGTYSIVVRGNSTGQTERTATVSFTVNAPPGITLGLASTALSVVTGTTGTANLSLTRAGGFTGDVALTATGLPTGATIAFAPATFTGTGSTSTATITVGAATAPGTYNVVLTGTGAGGIVSSQTLALTVAAAQGITVAATNATAQQGATATSNVTLTRAGGFAGAVGLAVTGLPAGVTATFTPASVTGTTSTLALAVGAGVAAGTYTGTITASGTGVTNATSTFTLTVTTAGTGGGAVGFRFGGACGPLPTFFAFRNGTTGGWTTVTGAADGTFTFNATGNQVQIAYAVPNASGGAAVTVLYYAASELSNPAGVTCNSATTNTKTVTGTVAGLSSTPVGTFPQTTQSATIALGSASASPQGNGAFTITGAPDGTTDVVAVRTTNTTSLAGATLTVTSVPDRVIIRRGVNPATGGSIGPTIDFGAAEAVAAATAAYSITNLNGDAFQAISTFSSANGGSAPFFGFSAVNGAVQTTSPATVYGVPASLTQAGDLHQVIVSTMLPTGSAVGSTRSVIQWNRDLTARTIALGPAVTAPTYSTIATTPYARIRATGPLQAEYGDVVGLSYSQAAGNRNWNITATRTYLGGAGVSTYTVDMPDLSGVGNFNNAWGLQPGVATTASYTTYAGLFGITAIGEGTSFRFGTFLSNITP